MRLRRTKNLSSEFRMTGPAPSRWDRDRFGRIRKQSAFTLLNRVPFGKFNRVHLGPKRKFLCNPVTGEDSPQYMVSRVSDQALTAGWKVSFHRSAYLKKDLFNQTHSRSRLCLLSGMLIAWFQHQPEVARHGLQ